MFAWMLYTSDGMALRKVFDTRAAAVAYCEAFDDTGTWGIYSVVSWSENAVDALIKSEFTRAALDHKAPVDLPMSCRLR